MINTIENYYLLLLIYSFAGWIWESVICALIFEKKLINSGFFIGPYCPIYGFGALLDINSIGVDKRPDTIIFFKCIYLLHYGIHYIICYGKNVSCKMVGLLRHEI